MEIFFSHIDGDIGGYVAGMGGAEEIASFGEGHSRQIRLWMIQEDHFGPWRGEIQSEFFGFGFIPEDVGLDGFAADDLNGDSFFTEAWKLKGELVIALGEIFSTHGGFSQGVAIQCQGGPLRLGFDDEGSGERSKIAGATGHDECGDIILVGDDLKIAG